MLRFDLFLLYIHVNYKIPEHEYRIGNTIAYMHCNSAGVQHIPHGGYDRFKAIHKVEYAVGACDHLLPCDSICNWYM